MFVLIDVANCPLVCFLHFINFCELREPTHRNTIYFNKRHKLYYEIFVERLPEFISIEHLEIRNLLCYLLASIVASMIVKETNKPVDWKLASTA